MEPSAPSGGGQSPSPDDGGKEVAPESTSLFRFALGNESKLNDGSATAFTSWLQSNQISLALTAEGCCRKSLNCVEGFGYVGPLNKAVRGGAGFFGTTDLLRNRHVTIHENSEQSWAVAVMRIQEVTFASCYVRPSTTVNALHEFFACLEQISASQLVIGGDFNAKTGSVLRRRLDAFADSRGWQQITTSLQPTHFTNSSASDIDVLWAKGIPVRLASASRPTTGHSRQVFEIMGFTHDHLLAPKQIDWKKLYRPDLSSQFTSRVKEMLQRGEDIDSAIHQCAGQLLGYRQPGRPSQLSSRDRRKVRATRRALKFIEHGSAEHRRCVAAMQLIFEKNRFKGWKRKLARIASSGAVNSEAWQVSRRMSGALRQHPNVGPNVEEMVTKYSKIYSDNTTDSTHWDVPARPAMLAGDEDFSCAEVQAAVRSLPRGKAAGPSGIPYEAYSSLLQDKAILDCFTATLNGYLHHGYYVPSFGKLCLIPKADGGERPLLLINCSRKLLEKVILERARKRGLLTQFHDTQGGFRENRGCYRQLLIMELLIQDVRRAKRPAVVRCYDIAKAFDKIPRRFIGSQLLGKWQSQAPHLAYLMNDLLNVPTFADYRGSQFQIKTGVPQGGLLSPALFICGMDPLLWRLDQTGIRTSFGCSGTFCYADDVCLVDDDVATADRRLAYFDEFLAETGMTRNSSKTQSLEIPSGTNSVKYLGTHIRATGITCIMPPSEMTTLGNRLRIRELPPAMVFTILQAKVWSKVSYGSLVALPEMFPYIQQWNKLARLVLGTYHSTHHCLVMRELGRNCSPLYWQLSQTLKFYHSVAHGRDTFAKEAVRQAFADPEHPTRRKLEILWLPAGVTWSQLLSLGLPALLKNATTRYAGWFRFALTNEAKRLSIYDESDPAWTESWERTGCARYLRLNYARIGFLFRLPSFNPPRSFPLPCLFCGCEEGDNGMHAVHCDAVRLLVPLPNVLQKLPPAELDRSLRLLDSTPDSTLRCVLVYMVSIWRRRTDRWLRLGKPKGEPIVSFGQSGGFLRKRQISVRETILTENAHPPKRCRRSPAVIPPVDARTSSLSADIIPLSSSTSSLTIPISDFSTRVVNRKRAREVHTTADNPPAPAAPTSVASTIATPLPLCHRKRLRDKDGSPSARTLKRARPALSPHPTISPIPAVASSETLQICASTPSEALVLLPDNQALAVRTVILSPPRRRRTRTVIPSDPEIRKTGRWSPDEEEKLVEAIRLLGTAAFSALGRAVGTRSFSQVQTKLESLAFRNRLRELGLLPAADPHTGVTSSLVSHAQ